jgi:hypothetical protein
MTRKQVSGRPVSYTLDDRQRFAELIRQHGARGAREHKAAQTGVLYACRDFCRLT